jgi:hypothetical protein
MHPQTRDAGAARCWTWHKGRKRERRRPPRSPPRVRVGMSRPQIARDTNRDGSLCDGLPAPAPESVGAGRPYPPTTASRTPGSTARPAPTWFRTSPPTAPLSHITLERRFGTRRSGQAWYVTRPTRMGHSRSRLQGGSPHADRTAPGARSCRRRLRAYPRLRPWTLASARAASDAGTHGLNGSPDGRRNQAPGACRWPGTHRFHQLHDAAGRHQ